MYSRIVIVTQVKVFRRDCFDRQCKHIINDDTSSRRTMVLKQPSDWRLNKYIQFHLGYQEIKADIRKSTLQFTVCVQSTVGMLLCLWCRTVRELLAQWFFLVDKRFK